MVKHDPDQQRLLAKVKAKRHELAAYLGRQEPRHRRLVRFSIIAGALAAALTAGPGVGGVSLVSAVGDRTPLGLPVWQVLCLAASVLSVAVVVANGLLSSQDTRSRINQARGCDAKLEGLETMLELSQVETEDAARLYAEYLTEIPHV